MAADRQRRQPRNLTLRIIDEASRISPEDLERARQRWHKLTVPEYRGLIDAVEVDDGTL